MSSQTHSPGVTGPSRSHTFGALMLCATLLGCALIFESDRVQCQRDEDCEGTSGSNAGLVCEAGLCVPADDSIENDKACTDAHGEDTEQSCAATAMQDPDLDAGVEDNVDGGRTADAGATIFR